MVSVLFAGILATAALGWGAPVLVPLILAVLLTFLLAPPVAFFERHGLGRAPSVIVVVLLAFSVLGAAGWGLGSEVGRLAGDLPGYRANVKQRAAALRDAARGGLLQRFQAAADDVLVEINRGTPGGKPVAQERVVIASEPLSVLPAVPSLLDALGSAGFVFALVLFMLLERRELRNRMLRLAGHGHLAITTRAIDEAGRRISRYLGMQSLINASFGLVVGVGVHWIGLPYALLCGCLAAALRFIPFVGSIVGAGLPILISLAVFPGWSEPLLVAGLILIAELASSLILEPWLYGQSTGVSQVALLVAVGFWTWLWGPIGLVVATPLTVCIVVFARHVPGLEFLVVLLADRPALDLDCRLYQRLLAGDRDEVDEIVREFLTERPADEIYDELLIPALVRMRRDRDEFRLSAGDEDAFISALGDVMNAMRTTRLAVGARATDESATTDGGAPGRAETPGGTEPEIGKEGVAVNPAPGCLRVPVVGHALRGDADEIAVAMLRDLLAPHGFVLRSAPPDQRRIPGSPENPAMVFVLTLPPGGAAAAREFARGLRRRSPGLDVSVLTWCGSRAAEPPMGPTDDEATAPASMSTAESTVGTLLEARDRLLGHIRIDRTSIAGSAIGESEALLPSANRTRPSLADDPRV